MASAISFVKATAAATGAAAPGAAASSAKRGPTELSKIMAARLNTTNRLISIRPTIVVLLDNCPVVIAGHWRSSLAAVASLPLELIHQLKRDCVLRVGFLLETAAVQPIVVKDLAIIRRLIVPVLNAGEQMIQE